jgi:cobalt-zinc-cadmium efflux system protein
VQRKKKARQAQDISARVRKMAHDHHHHAHAHGPKGHGRAFAVGIALNLAFVAVESVYGILSHSMALLADAGHNLSDVLALGLAWGASVLGRREPSQRFTYGLGSSTILAALVNAMLLMLVVGGIALEAIQRLMNPCRWRRQRSSGWRYAES